MRQPLRWTGVGALTVCIATTLAQAQQPESLAVQLGKIGMTPDTLTALDVVPTDIPELCSWAESVEADLSQLDALRGAVVNTRRRVRFAQSVLSDDEANEARQLAASASTAYQIALFDLREDALGAIEIVATQSIHDVLNSAGNPCVLLGLELSGTPTYRQLSGRIMMLALSAGGSEVSARSLLEQATSVVSPAHQQLAAQRVARAEALETALAACSDTP